jgi:hypothetical protein
VSTREGPLVRAITLTSGLLSSKKGVPISIRLLNHCHRMLMQGARSANKQPVEPRRSQN